MTPPAEANNVYTRALDGYKADDLNNVVETTDTDIEKRFDNVLTSNAGYFDVVAWNIYSILTDHYAKNTKLKGGNLWNMAHKHTDILAANLSKIPSQEGGDKSVLEHLLSLAKSRKIKKISLSKDFDFSFIGKEGEVLFKFNAIELRKSGIVTTSQDERRKIQEAPVLRYGDGAAELAELFSPLENVPRLPANKRLLKFSPLDLYRGQKAIPKIIPDKLRGEAVCAGFAFRLLSREFSQKERKEMGLVDEFNAWDLKSILAKKGAIEVPPLNTFDAVKVSKTDRPKVTDVAKYNGAVKKFYEKADQGAVPSVLTVYYTGTAYYNDVVKANKSRSPEACSYNSHLVVIIGRENQKSSKAESEIKATALLKKNLPKVNPELYASLNVEVHKKNGEVVLFGENGEGEVNLEDFKLQEGDEIKWSDLVVTDFIHGKERAFGLAELASDKSFIILENLCFKDKQRPPSKYPVLGYFQIKKGVPVSKQIRDAIKPEKDEDYSNYIVALEDSGEDPDVISENDILPIFDLEKLRVMFKNPADKMKAHMEFMRGKVTKYNSRTDESGVFILIEEGKTPWQIFGKLFEDKFPGNRWPLSAKEKRLVLYAIDASSKAIDLREETSEVEDADGNKERVSKIVKYHAGSAVFLDTQRIDAIAAHVIKAQNEWIGPSDYTRIVESGDIPYAIIAEWFDKESTGGIKYKELDQMEKNYLFNAFVSCNAGREVDLQTELKMTDYGIIEDFKSFNPGARVVMRKADLAKCVLQISKKRRLQKPLEKVSVSIPVGENDEREQKDVPKDIMEALNKAYPGTSLTNTYIRNMLCLMWAKEKASGFVRGAVKGAWSIVEDLNSVGEFQMRPNMEDLTPQALKLMKENGISLDKFLEADGSLPKDPGKQAKLLAHIRYLMNGSTVVEKTALTVSVILVGQRVKFSMNFLSGCAKKNGETANYMDEDAVIMAVASYNRGPSAVLRAMFQSWAISAGELAGLNTSTLKTQFDGLLQFNEQTREGFDGVKDEAKLIYLKWRDPENLVRWTREQLVTSTIGMILAVAAKEGIELSPDAKAQAEKIRAREVFTPADINGPLFVAIQNWYKSKTGEKLSVILSPEDRQKGDNVYSYGTYVLERGGQKWSSFFKDYDSLNEVVADMQGDYAPVSGDEERKLVASSDAASGVLEAPQNVPASDYPIETIKRMPKEKVAEFPQLNKHGYVSILLTGRDADSHGERPDTIKQILINPLDPSEIYVINISRDIDIDGKKLNETAVGGSGRFLKAVEEITGEDVVYTVGYNFDTFKIMADKIIEKLGKFHWKDPNGYSYIEGHGDHVYNEYAAEMDFTDSAKLLTFLRARYVRPFGLDGRELKYDGSDSSRQVRQVQVMMQLLTQLRAVGKGRLLTDPGFMSDLYSSAEGNIGMPDMSKLSRLATTSGFAAKITPISTAAYQSDKTVHDRSFQDIDRLKMRRAVSRKLLPNGGVDVASR